jgi:hypothetical protein
MTCRMPRYGTGLSSQDAQDDFNRARRRRVLARLSQRLRGEPSDFNLVLPFEEVVAALGQTGQTELGLQVIRLDSIVGSVGRTRDFDRSFRPTSGRSRKRWERIASAQRRGESMPPIDVFRIGDMHFVKDGHHRVSVARALGHEDIDAYVTEVHTRVGADGSISLKDLPLKSHERVFLERVPLPPDARARVRPSDPWAYACLAEGVEAWGFRLMQDLRELMARDAVAQAWYRDEYLPVVEMLREADLIGSGSETDAYMRVVDERYRLMRTHEWSDDILERLREELR